MEPLLHDDPKQGRAMAATDRGEFAVKPVVSWDNPAWCDFSRVPSAFKWDRYLNLSLVFRMFCAHSQILQMNGEASKHMGTEADGR